MDSVGFCSLDNFGRRCLFLFSTAGRIVVGALVIIPLLFVVQALVETNREKLENTVHRMSELVDQQNIAEIVTLIDPNAQFHNGMDRDEFE